MYTNKNNSQSCDDCDDEKKENTVGHHRAQIDGYSAVTGGIIEEVKEIVTKNGKTMAFLKLADFNDMIEGVVFSETYEKFKNLLIADKCVAVKGKISRRNGEPSIVVEAVKEL